MLDPSFSSPCQKTSTRTHLLAIMAQSKQTSTTFSQKTSWQKSSILSAGKKSNVHAARWPPLSEERLDSPRQTSHGPTVQNRPSNMQGSHPRGCCDEPGSSIDGAIGRQVPYMSQESLPYASCASGVVPNQGFVNLTLTSQ